MIILIPTELEAQYIHPTIEVVICGVGMAEAAATMAHIATTQHPDRVILAGIAGVYRHSPIEVGDVVEVVSEQIEELPERFGRHYEVEAQWGLPTAHSNSVNSTITITPTADIENMEGAAVMAICERLSIPFSEIRAISNRVGDPFAKWEVERATKALAEAISTLYNSER